MQRGVGNVVGGGGRLVLVGAGVRHVLVDVPTP